MSICECCDMKLQDLAQAYQLDPEIIRIWSKHESDTLLPIQEQAIREYRMLEGQDVLVSAPTSSGKTFLAEIAAIHTIFRRQKVVYLLPLKALAEEKYADFVEKYEAFGIDVVISTGDRTEFDKLIERGEFQLAVIVFEKAARLLVRNRHFIDYCGLVIIDEIQMTADSSRGSGLEILLTAILRTRTQEQHPQLIALSAVIGDMNRLHEWLGMQTLVSDQRPVELQEGILRKDGVFTYRSFLSKETGTENFEPFPAHLTFNLKSAEGKREYHYQRLRHYVAHFLAQGEQVLIFRKWKWLTRDTALRLARDLQLPPALQALEAAQNMEDSISKEILLESLRHGVAFHNADLGGNERQMIERYFREENSKIRILCATSTLAMGINLPVNTVIINDLEKPEQHAEIFQEIPLTSAEYKNMSGRAGRLKRRDKGRSVIFADSAAEEKILWRTYIDGAFPRMTSLLAESRMAEEILFLVAAGICVSEKEILDFLMASYSGTLYWKADAESADRLRETVADALAFCLQHAILVTTPTTTLQSTEIGRICASQGVSVATLVTLQEFFAAIDPATCDVWEILFIATHNHELEGLHFRLSQEAFESGEYWRAIQELNPPNWEKLTAMSERLFQNRFEVTKRMEMSLLLRDWISGMNLRRIELKYNQFYRDKSYSGVIRGLAENIAWMIRLLLDLAAIHHQEDATMVRLHTLAKMVSYGVPEQGIELASLHVAGLTRTMIMQLIAGGYTKEEHLLDAELEDLGRIVPREIAFRLQATLYKKYRREETRSMVDQKLRLERLGYDSASLKQVYASATLDEFSDALLRLLRSPQMKLLLQELAATSFGKDYLLERETGSLFLRILPPNSRELSEEQLGNLLAVGISQNPTGFVIIGRPDFTEAAVSKAKQFSTAYSKSLSLYPAYEICERYVRALEEQAEFQL